MIIRKHVYTDRINYYVIDHGSVAITMSSKFSGVYALRNPERFMMDKETLESNLLEVLVITGITEQQIEMYLAEMRKVLAREQQQK